MSGESKQQRKARHRAHGQVLPTIEDSSEEEELREEEELLMEQEKQRELEQQQRKSSSRKSKKDKDELRAQRRRERPKTPPSNLSPIEDASPTEELRQAAEMEELHRSSCSEYSPSIESEPEGFEISPDKILAVQKVYKLPTSVSLYSPTDEKNIDISQKATTPKSLKCADEVYEEIMQKAKLLQSQKETDVTHEKEPLYGGMLIEDYIYESLVEDTYSGTTDSSYLIAQQESSKGVVQEPGKKLRSPDQVFDNLMQTQKYQTEEEYYYSQPSNETLPQHAMSLPPSVSKTSLVSDSTGGVEPSTKEEKPLLVADAAYEELMKRQRAILTPGTSPTQPPPVSSDLSITSSATGFREIHGESIMSSPITGHEPATCTSVVVTVAPLSSTIYPIPDVTITQHFTAEEDIEEAFINEYANRFGYRDDHYQYDRPGPYGMRGVGSMKPSMSETNLAEAGLFLYKSKNSFDYRSGVTEDAVDLTSGRRSAGEIMNYSSKSTGPYPETRQVISGTGISIPQYSHARITPPVGTQYGVNSVLRSSNGVVYSSVAAPVPSMFAITTQPGSVFSTTYKDWSGLHTSDTMPSLSSLQNQPLPRSYSFLTITATGQERTAGLETSLQSRPLETLMTGQSELIPTVTTASESYTDASLDAIALSLEALASPIAYDDSKQQQYQMERELLELEKLKQLRLAEELEWERQEIQRFREQDKLIVQQELEELHTMKHQLLLQQEEERHAHLMMQQETFAQQQMQLEQIQQLQHQLQQQLEEQKIRQIYQYSYDQSGSASPQTSSEQVLQDAQYTAGENGQYWPIQDETATSSAVSGIELQQNATWYTVPSEGIAQFIPSLPNSVSEMSLKDIDVQEDRQLKKRSSMPRLHGKYEEPDKPLHDDVRLHKKIVDSGVQTDDEDGVDRSYTGRRRRTKKSVDTSVQTDDEDQEWDIPTRSRRRSRVSKYGDSTETDKNKHNSKVSSIAIQTVTEISVQTEPVGTIRTPSIRAQMDTKVDIKKHISAPEKTYKGSSLSCQTEVDTDKQTGQYSPQKDKKHPTPLEIGYSTHLKADSSLQVAPSPPKSPKVLYSPISPVSPSKSLEFVPYEKALGAEITPQEMSTSEASTAPPPSPRTMKMMQRSMSDPKPRSPTADESTRPHFQYSDGYSTKGSQSGTPSGTQKKVKRTLPNPPPEEDTAENQSGYTTVGSVSRRRICRTNTMARAKILHDIDRELDLVERESSKLRKKQAELDEEEKEIDAKLRYLEMGINRRKDALLKEREKRERAYLQGVAEERDYMSDSEISNIRGTRVDSQHGLERPRTAPQSEFDQFMPPQTQPESQYAEHTSPYTQYEYAPPSLPTQAPSQYPQQTHYQQQSLYHQQVSPYQTQPSYSSVPTISYPQAPLPQSQQPNYQHPSQMLLMQKPRQTTLADLEPKITTNYEVIRNQPLMIVPSSTETTYAVPHMGSKYSNLDLRIGLDDRSSMVSSPISNISADSFYADIEQHTPRNYVLIDDIGELTKGSTSMSSTFNIPDKDLTKTDRLLRTGELRRTPEVTDFLGPLQTSSRMHTYGKADEDSMEDPYELKLLKQQIKQEFRRGTEGLDHMSGLPHCYQSDSSYRHFPKTEKYSISRLTLEKQAAKQLPSSVLYQKQTKQKKPLMDPKVTKFSPIQESRDIEPDYSNYLASSTSSVSGLSSRAKLLQDDITFGLRKNISDQQKYLGSTLGANLAHSLGNALNLVPNMQSSLHDDLDKPYPSGTRSRPSSRPSSVYGLDLSIKRGSSSTSLRLKTQENEPLDVSYTHAPPSVRTKPTSLPISQSRGRIPIVAQNSEEESPLSPVGQPMGMARAAAGPLPPISADTREQFGSSHSLPEVQQHMREESRTCGYDRDIAFIMDDFQHAMSDSEGTTDFNLISKAYHLRREETDWFDKPRESRIENGHALDRRLPERMSHSKQSQHQQGDAKPIQYSFPYSKIKLQKDPKDHSVSGNGLGIRVVGGKEIPGNNGEIGAYIAKILPAGTAEQTGKVVEASEDNAALGSLQASPQAPGQSTGVAGARDLNMLSDSKNPEHLELNDQTKDAERQRSPGVDPKQLAAELQKVSQQQAPSSVISATEKGTHIHSGTPSAASSAVPSPGQPGSPSVSKKRHSSKSFVINAATEIYCIVENLDECLLVSLPPPSPTPAKEGDKPQSPARKAEPHQSPAREAEQHQSPAKGGDYTLLPPPSPGDYTLLPPSSPGDHTLLPPPLLLPQEPEGEELQAQPPEIFWGGEGQDAGVPQQPLFLLLKAARRAPARPPQQREPAPPQPPSEWPASAPSPLPPPPPPSLLWEDCLPLPPLPAEGEYLLVPPSPLWEDCWPLPPPPAEGEYLLVPPSPLWEDCWPLPPPPAEGEYLLVPPSPLWEDCWPLPPPPAEGEYLLVPPSPLWEDCWPLPPPPAEGEYLLVPPSPLWEDCWPLPPPPAEGEYLLVPPSPLWEDCWPLPPPPAEGEYLLVPPSPLWEDCWPLPPPPAEGEYLLVPPSPLWEDCWPLPPPPAEGEYLLVPPSPLWEDCWPLPPPPAEGEYLLVPPSPLWEDCWPLPPPPAEDEYLLVPPPPGTEEQGLPLLPVPPPEGVRWPEPQKGELPATKKGEEVWRPLSPAAVSLQEFLWPEPHRRELPATKKWEEVIGPAPTAALSLLEIMGEVRRPAPTAALSLQEVLWPQPHHGELPATKKGEVGGPPAPAAFPLPGLPRLKESVWELSARLLTAWPVAAWLLATLPPVGPLKPPFPARDFVLDFWAFKGGGGR
ncbi:UNVERIFIED_CONTAM: hypothetical protein FKN15_016278 [Acipenser sinensis]